jgi:hypothetical protein
MRETALKVIRAQCEIISLQAEIAGELYSLLEQYLSTEELNALPLTDKLHEVAKLWDAAGMDEDTLPL